MSKHEDGGYAFPYQVPASQVSEAHAWEGMTLRDYFAAQVLAGGLARSSMLDYELRAIFGEHRTGVRREEIMAADAFLLADAMLAARKA